TQIGLLAASGPAVLLLVIGVIFALRKIRQRRIKLQRQKGEERPTMRQVEMALEAFQTTKNPCLDNVVVRNSEENITRNHLLTRRRTNKEEGSRQYSLEKGYMG
ncbi:hypothetical protein EJB05_44055, partial [Eragrostis curvula]